MMQISLPAPMLPSLTSLASIGDLLALEAVLDLPIDGVANTYDLLRRGAVLAPDAPALSFFMRAQDYAQPHVWSHAENLGQITRAANMFRKLGLERGELVAFILPNLPETHWTIWGGETAGIVMAINPMLEAGTIGQLLQAAQPRLVVTVAPASGQELWDKVAQAVAGIVSLQAIVAVSTEHYGTAAQGAGEAAPLQVNLPVHDFHSLLMRESAQQLDFAAPALDDIASYFCTGGTTGMPKIAVRTHLTEVANALQVTAVIGDALMRPGDTMFCGLPLFHVNAQLVTGLSSWSHGGHVLLATPQGYRAPQLISLFWEIVAHHRVVAFSGVPTIYAALLQAPSAELDLSCVRLGICGAAPMPQELFKRFMDTFGIRIGEGYGLTEGGCVSTLNIPGGDYRYGSIGLRLPWQGVRIAILDAHGAYVREAQADEIGTLLIRGANLFKGYLDPVHNRGIWVTCPDGEGRQQDWFNTGDLGRMEADGHVWLAGRTKELIIRGGHNIDPKWIEEPLCRHPAVALAAAVGRPDAYAGELPVAYVQLHPGATATPEQLQQFALEHIPERAALPKAIHIMAALPTTTVGKIFKPDLLRREILSVVQAEASALQLELLTLEARPDERHGTVIEWRAAGDTAAFQAALARYTFQHRVRVL
ncbi:acyl-CoA synthetase [Janthinobacterium sp. BJB304]|uniref:acyl-CoA synthetase n=1 Tax=Janthinobacterium sp. BJB304 TaxID=1572871 RepID=UPI000C1126DB|nr:acyl-CoA synthetase [Janthinobacterium sp. BJB304]PHV35982.1 acyl-CoA synthetase [Janthinobacterium sp. BJB304]